MFKLLYDIYINMLTTFEDIWEWLTTEHTIMGQTFTPIFLTGGVVVAFIVARIVKEFVPLS